MSAVQVKVVYIVQFCKTDGQKDVSAGEGEAGRISMM